jgi:hypothetical protein
VRVSFVFTILRGSLGDLALSTPEAPAAFARERSGATARFFSSGATRRGSLLREDRVERERGRF